MILAARDIGSTDARDPGAARARRAAVPRHHRDHDRTAGRRGRARRSRRGRRPASIRRYKAVVDWDRAAGSWPRDRDRVHRRLGRARRAASASTTSPPRIARFHEVRSVYLVSGGHDLRCTVTGAQHPRGLRLRGAEALDHRPRAGHRHPLRAQDLQARRRRVRRARPRPPAAGDPVKPLNGVIAACPPSGIRRFFDIAAEMDDVISLGVGEPDFVTPVADPRGRHLRARARLHHLHLERRAAAAARADLRRPGRAATGALLRRTTSA